MTEHITQPERAERRASLLAALRDLELCPACRSCPYCYRHTVERVRELLREATALLSAG